MVAGEEALESLKETWKLNKRIELIWIDSNDPDFQKALFEKVFSQEERLSELFKAIQVEMTPDRAGKMHKHIYQVYNLDENLQAKTCLRNLFGLRNFEVAKLEKEVCVPFKVSKNSDESFSWNIKRRAVPKLETFAYSVLLDVLESPMVRQEFIFSFTPNPEAGLLRPRIKAKKQPSKSLSQMQKLNESQRNLSYQVTNPKVGTQEKLGLFRRKKIRAKKGKESKRAVKDAVEKSPKVRSKSYQDISMQSQAKLNMDTSMSMQMLLDDTQSFRASGSQSFSLLGNSVYNSSDDKAGSIKELVTRFEKFSFDKDKFIVALTDRNEPTSVFSEIHYSTEVLPMSNRILSTSLTSVIVFSYSDFTTKTLELEKKITDCIKNSLHANPKILFVLTTRNSRSIVVEDVAQFIKIFKKQLHFKLAFKTESFFSVLSVFEEQQELTQLAFEAFKDPSKGVPLNFVSLDLFESLVLRCKETNRSMPVHTIFKNNRELKQLEDCGIVLKEGGFVILKPGWLLRKVKLLFNIVEFQKHLNQFQGIPKKALKYYKAKGVLHGKVLNALLSNNKNEKPNKDEQQNFRGLLKELNIISTHYFNSFKERYIFLLQLPNNWKPQVYSPLQYEFLFIFKSRVPKHFIGLLLTIFSNLLNHALLELKQEYGLMQKNRKKKAMWTKLQNNTMIRPYKNCIELRKRHLVVRLSLTEAGALSLETNTRIYPKKLFELVSSIFDKVNNEYFYNQIEISELVFKHRNVVQDVVVEEMDVEELQERGEFPFDFQSRMSETKANSLLGLENLSYRFDSFANIEGLIQEKPFKFLKKLLLEN